MYDYDSNVILSCQIKLRNSADLIIGIKTCSKVLAEANITSIVHELDNKI